MYLLTLSLAPAGHPRRAPPTGSGAHLIAHLETLPFVIRVASTSFEQELRVAVFTNAMSHTQAREHCRSLRGAVSSSPQESWDWRWHCNAISIS